MSSFKRFEHKILAQFFKTERLIIEYTIMYKNVKTVFKLIQIYLFDERFLHLSFNGGLLTDAKNALEPFNKKNNIIVLLFYFSN